MYVDAYYTHNTIFVKCRKKNIYEKKKSLKERKINDIQINTHTHTFI